MQGYGKAKLDLVISHLADELGDPRSGYGDALGREAQPLFLGGDTLDSLHHIGVVHQGLAHAHKDDIAQRTPIV